MFSTLCPQEPGPNAFRLQQQSAALHQALWTLGVWKQRARGGSRVPRVPSQQHSSPLRCRPLRVLNWAFSAIIAAASPDWGLTTPVSNAVQSYVNRPGWARRGASISELLDALPHSSALSVRGRKNIRPPHYPTSTMAFSHEGQQSCAGQCA